MFQLSFVLAIREVGGVGARFQNSPAQSRLLARGSRGHAAPPAAVEKFGKVAPPTHPRTSRLVIVLVSLVEAVIGPMRAFRC